MMRMSILAATLATVIAVPAFAQQSSDRGD